MVLQIGNHFIQMVSRLFYFIFLKFFIKFYLKKLKKFQVDRDKCKLACMPENGSSEILFGIVTDGTKCDLHTHDVCVDGICEVSFF